jgi:hypothetical protein
MPGHWLYRFFPEIWKNERQRTLDASQMFNTLSRAGFGVRLSRSTLYQSVTLGDALRIASLREQVPQLVNLPDLVYQKQLTALEEMVQQQGETHSIISEFCLVEVSAVWG